MRAATYDAFATDNSRLKVDEVPDPKVGPGQVLIEVRAAGVNPVDWKVMAGGMDPMMDTWFPVIPGWDVAGVVRKTGPDTPEFSPGDEVMSYARKDVVHAGTFAEYVAVAATAVARKPDWFDWHQAGGLPLVGLTALRCMDWLEVGPGDVLLVHGASGGVGMVGVQIARARGARVIGTASESNHERLRELGVQPVAHGDGLVGRVRELAPGGVSAVADFAGGQLETTLELLVERRRHVSITDRSVAEHGGHWIWVRPDGSKLAELADLVDRGLIKLHVSAVYKLHETGAAFDASRSGHPRGKLVITP